METKIPVVIIGGGTIAHFHAKCILASPSCTLDAIVDPFETGRELARETAVAHFESLESLLESYTSTERRRPELYLICVPSALHVPVATNVLQKAAPKVLLVEKPFSTDSASGADLLALATEKNCKIAVGHHRRFHPRIVAAKEVVASGSLGQITALSSLWTCKKPDGYYAVAPWRASRSKGGGPVWTNLVHDVDVLAYLVGSRIVRLWAKSTVRRREALVEAGDLVEEGAAVMLEFENGVVGTLVLCDNVPSPYGWESATGENTAIARNGPGFSLGFDAAKDVGGIDSYRIFGSHGTLSAPDGVVWRCSRDEAERLGREVGWGVPLTREVIGLQEGDPYERQIEHLARVVAGQEEPVCPGEAGLAAVRVCEAIVEAIQAQGHGPIELYP